MKLLLDTHAFLWLLGERTKLSQRALDACSDRKNELFLSVVSVWEIGIKRQLGKLELDVSLPEVLAEWQAGNDLRILSIELQHVIGVDELPLHHNDPFDRLLIAQARVENMHLVSADGRVLCRTALSSDFTF